MELIKIFLSYASEDYSLVSDFYDRLKKIGINSWMDKKDILPGENWERSIWRAVKNADFIILFLSNHSVNKRGFFQKEIKIIGRTVITPITLKLRNGNTLLDEIDGMRLLISTKNISKQD